MSIVLVSLSFYTCKQCTLFTRRSITGMFFIALTVYRLIRQQCSQPGERSQKTQKGQRPKSNLRKGRWFCFRFHSSPSP